MDDCLASWCLFGLGSERQTGQKIELGRQARRHRQIEMTKCGLGQHPATRGTLHEPLLYQIRLDDLLDDIALVAERGCHRFDPDRAAPVVFGDAAQVAPIHTVEAAPVDFEPQQRRIGGRPIDARQTLDGMDRRYLRCIAENYGGGPVGVETMAAALGDERDVIEEVVEPYLIQEGFVQRTSRGRVLTQIAFRYLDLPMPASLPAQLDLLARLPLEPEPGETP